MSSDVEKIKERLNIVDVISSYIKLEKAGKNFRAKCPFHNEKTPSFFVSPERGGYYCFGCNRGGDILSFVEEFEGMDFKGALSILAQKAGVELKRGDPKTRDERERLYGIMEEATSFFEDLLDKHPEINDYLKKRGLTASTVKEFRLGFVPNEWRLVYSFLKNKGFNDNEIEKAGLVKKTDKGYYDRFRGRIMFPISDSSGRIIAFSGRILEQTPTTNTKGEKVYPVVSESSTTGAPKYLNSPDTILFNKSEVLYGYDKAKSAMRKNNFCILVEGQIDLLLSHQAGFRNTVALSGTSLTLNHLQMIKRITNKLVFAFDSDSAGFSAANRGAKMALSFGIDLKVARIEPGYDPADIIVKDLKGWKKAIRESEHIIDFYFHSLLSRGYEKRKLGMAIQEELLPYVAEIDNKIDQAHFIRNISEQANILEEAIWEDVKAITKAQKQESTKTYSESIQDEKESMLRKDSIERKILGILYWQETLDKSAIDLDEIKKRFINIIGDDYFQKISKEKEDIKKSLIFEAEVFYSDSSKLQPDLEEMFLNLEEDYLKEQLVRAMGELNEAEKLKDHKKSGMLLQQCQKLSARINEIKTSRLK